MRSDEYRPAHSADRRRASRRPSTTTRSPKSAAPRRPASMTFAAPAPSAGCRISTISSFSAPRSPAIRSKAIARNAAPTSSSAAASPRRRSSSKIPITIAGMSFGSLSGPAKEALGRGATLAGTSTTTGDGGMTAEERTHSQLLVYQVLPSRYGMNPDDLRRADAIEVVVGQGAKPGGGGMLLGQKISKRVADDAQPARGHRPALRLPASRLDRTRRSRDQDRGAARDHRLGEADLRQDRRVAALLRHRARGEVGRRRRRPRRHAGRHRGDPGSLHRACRHPDACRHPARR